MHVIFFGRDSSETRTLFGVSIISGPDDQFPLRHRDGGAERVGSLIMASELDI
jgi:hypothetical protein